ncbi:MAG: DUF1805 domain-containing protein [Candidatus Omnitrophota bacterium]|nr:DUF1805 domain-containing protein [Candidatus Omnitrophota bacterium]
MLAVTKKIKTGSQTIEALLFPLQGKNLIVLRGSRGYVMCGYLNTSVARKCNDAAVKITGVATIADALRARVHSLTPAARRLGIKKGDIIKDILALIA